MILVIQPRVHEFVSGQPRKGKTFYVLQKRLSVIKEPVLYVTPKDEPDEAVRGYVRANWDNSLISIRNALMNNSKIIYRLQYDEKIARMEIEGIVALLFSFPRNISVGFDEFHNYVKEKEPSNPLFRVAQEGLWKIRAFYTSQFPSVCPKRILRACEIHSFYSMTPYEERYAKSYFAGITEEIKNRLKTAGQWGRVDVLNGEIITRRY